MFSKFTAFINSVFAEPVFNHGERVNLHERGNLVRTDGFVLTQTCGNVLVEWPRGDITYVPSINLTLIAGSTPVASTQTDALQEAISV